MIFSPHDLFPGQTLVIWPRWAREYLALNKAGGEWMGGTEADISCHMPSPINPIYPLEEISSVDELMEIAVGVEHEAAARYESLAKIMENQGEAPLAATFRELAELERVHETGLGSWARREGRASPSPTLFAWHFPETFAWEDAGGVPPSPYQALSTAVDNEEKAFSFYTYLAAMAHARSDIRQRAEALAREELNHVAQLRRLRRRAYHRQAGEWQAGKLRGKRAAVSTLSELRRMAWGLETGSAQLAILAAKCLDDAGLTTGAIVIRQAKEQTERSLAMLAEDKSPLPGSPAVEAARGSGLLAPGALTSNGALALCERDAQEVLDVYLTIAEQAKDEVLLHAAQHLAETAMARLALIRSLIVP